jgi:hypothetical protein
MASVDVCNNLSTLTGVGTDTEAALYLSSPCIVHCLHLE